MVNLIWFYLQQFCITIFETRVFTHIAHTTVTECLMFTQQSSTSVILTLAVDEGGDF